MKESIAQSRQEKQKEVWKTFGHLHKKNPTLVAGLLTIQFLVVLFTYINRLDLSTAFTIAILFQILWVVVFFLLPGLWEILKALVGLAVFIGLGYLVFTYLGADGIVGLLVAGLVARILLAILTMLISIIVYTLPGFLAASLVFSLTESWFLAVGVFIAVTIMFSILLYLIFEVLVPFLAGFAWAWVSLAVSNQLSVGIVTGRTAWELFDISTQPGGTNMNRFQIADLINDIADLLMALVHLPGLLAAWAVLLGLAAGWMAMKDNEQG